MDEDNRSEVVSAQAFRERASRMAEAIEELCFPKGLNFQVGVMLLALHLTRRRVEYEFARSGVSAGDQKRLLDQAQAQRDSFDEAMAALRAERTAGQS